MVLMIETYGAAPMVADSLGYSYNLISDNLSIYSRYPIIRKYAFADSISTFNFGGVMIDVDGKPVRVFNTWLHYLPDMRLAPTDKSKEEILAWEMEGTRDEEIHKILSVLQPLLAEADSIPIIMGGDLTCILIWIGRKLPVTCIFMVVQWWIGLFPLLWKRRDLKIVSVR